MNFFRQSLISIPSQMPPQSILDTIGSYSIDQIVNEPIDPKDRKDLNKIYEQADIFVKRNSIITFNNKKQKKLLTTSFGINQSHTKPLLGKQQNTQFHIMAKEGALFQQIHPADVQKTHDDNIFDYRLHMKLARCEQIFKVEEVKRKSKRRPTGKQCQCCGRQYSKYHKCNHSICERKCGKPNLKRGQSRKDISSMWSDSKDENWSQENYEQEKGVKRSEKKIGRHQMGLSLNGEPSQYLLMSIDKLLSEKVLNNFSYKVIEIKEFEEQQEWNQEKDQENQQHLYYQKGVKEVNLSKRSNERQIFNQLMEEQAEFDGVANNQLQFEDNVNFKIEEQKDQQINKPKDKEYNQRNIREDCLLFDQENKLEIQPSNYEQQQLQQADGQNQKNKQSQEQQRQNNNNKEQRQNNSNNNKERQKNSEKQQKSGFQLNKINTNKQQIVPPSNSSSSSEEIYQQKIQDLPDQVKIPIDDQDQDNLMINQNQQPNQFNNNSQNQQPNNKQNNQTSNNQQIKNKQESLPDYELEQDSLNSDIEEIQHQNKESLIRNKLSKRSQVKVSKKLSKELKKLSKNILQSDSIQQVQLSLQPTPQFQQNYLITQNQPIQQEQGKQQQKRGRGKWRGMGHGKGILQEELDMYSQDSQLLQSDKQEEKQNQLFQKLEQKPVTKSFNSIMSDTQSKNQIGTPKRIIPNMDKIIQKIKFQLQNKPIPQDKNQDGKGLGRGKIFGRGLGVLQQTQQLQKQLEQDQIQIPPNQSQTKELQQDTKTNKHIKKNNSFKQKQEEQMQNDQNISLGDKFDQLIEEQEKNQNIEQNHLQNVEENNMEEECDQRTVNYISYLNRRETIIQPAQCQSYSSSGEIDPNELNQNQPNDNHPLQEQNKPIINESPVDEQALDSVMDLSQNKDQINNQQCP